MLFLPFYLLFSQSMQHFHTARRPFPFPSGYLSIHFLQTWLLQPFWHKPKVTLLLPNSSECSSEASYWFWETTSHYPNSCFLSSASCLIKDWHYVFIANSKLVGAWLQVIYRHVDPKSLHAAPSPQMGPFSMCQIQSLNLKRSVLSQVWNGLPEKF